MKPALADALAFALEVGAIDVKEIQRLADQEIAATNPALEQIIELAWSSSRSETLSILHTLAEGSEKQEASRLIAGYLKRSLESSVLSLRTVGKALARMASLGYLPIPEAENSMYFFAEDLALADIGELSPGLAAKVEEDLFEFLRQHAA